ncbi:peptidyl-tRNA hydrolase [Lophiostoma macrostomum CBS 122681]|uniref:peptidyl-tRNA hydrolase n=1 Tax=Lophiostoma macrostomum CBS 122681 TaxID=1314788 RepID=A0A6A6TGF2_9PLEO|nr:peptidyl-tRNA hydrolase [Lophiostoma macrostomum CBS 122681]
MANATARAHVRGREPTPTSADPDLENYEISDDEESEEETIAAAPRLNKKEQRKLKKQAKQKSKIESAIAELDDLDLAPAPTDTADDSGYQTDGSEPQLSKNQLKKLRKQEQKKQKAAARLDASDPSAEPTLNPTNPRKPTSDPTTTPSIPSTLSMPPTTHPLLICSLGNPGSQYARTLHSAGHFIINIIRERGLYLPFSAGMSGRVSTPDLTSWKLSFPLGIKRESSRSLNEGEDDFTLWQSIKLMNVSGPSVKNAWNAFCKQQRAKSADIQPRLVVLHDELEAQLGKVSVKQGSGSPRGHNGLKSCQGSLGGQQWWRVGVGIGRPDSREPDVVAKYVLRKMTSAEERALDRAAIDVLGALRRVAEGKV